MSLYQTNISPITKLSTFIKKYPNEKLHAQFQLLEESFPSHRIVRGDGNCFYRAFAFLYLVSHHCGDYLRLFPKVQWSYRKSGSYIRSDQQFQSQLYSIWSKYLKQLDSCESQSQKQKKLQSLFNQLQNFDQLMIGYFKSINHQHLKSQRNIFQSYVKNEQDFQQELQRVRTFDEESEGIQIYSLAHAMKMRIVVFYVDQSSFVPIQYMDDCEDYGLFLFYRPGHYDIVYPYQAETQHNPKEPTWLNYKTNFKNQPKELNKKQRSFHSPPPISQSKMTQSKLIDPQARNSKNNQKVGSSKINSQKDIKNSDEKNNRSDDKKTTYFQTNNFTNNGKFDLKYKPANDSYSNLTSSTSSPSTPNSKTFNSLKPPQQPVIINSLSDISQRLSIEVLGVVALSFIGYLCYSYF